MIRLEIKKNIFSFMFVISVFLLYMLFLLGDSGNVLPNGETTTIIGAIWNKYHNNWVTCSATSYLVRMFFMWTANPYLPVLMPFLCGLPSVINYLGEMETGNTKWILSRSSLKEYYLSKIVGNMLSAVLVALAAVALYYITLFVFFDKISIHDEEFYNVYLVFSWEMDENTSDYSLFFIFWKLCKGVLYFALYAIQSAAFCMCIAVWCKERYAAFSATIFLCYLQSRVVEELQRKYISEGVAQAGVAADILNPIFLHSAGYSGFYQEREGLAVVLSVLLIGLCYFMMVCLLRRSFDLSEG